MDFSQAEQEIEEVKTMTAAEKDSGII